MSTNYAFRLARHLAAQVSAVSRPVCRTMSAVAPQNFDIAEKAETFFEQGFGMWAEMVSVADNNCKPTA